MSLEVTELEPTSQPTEQPTDILDSFTADSDEFYAQCYSTVPIGIVLSIVYCILRLKFLERCESRRREAREVSADVTVDPKGDGDAESSEKVPIEFPNISETAYIGWIWEIVKMDSNTFYEYAGFDALVLVLLLKAIISMCLVCLPYVLVILLPVYGTAGSSTDALEVLSLTTVGSGNHRLIATVIGAFLVTLSTMYFLNDVYLKIATVTDKFWLGSTEIKGKIDQISWFRHEHENMAKEMEKHQGLNMVPFIGGDGEEKEEEKEKGGDGDGDEKKKEKKEKKEKKGKKGKKDKKRESKQDLLSNQSNDDTDLGASGGVELVAGGDGVDGIDGDESNNDGDDDADNNNNDKNGDDDNNTNKEEEEETQTEAPKKSKMESVDLVVDDDADDDDDDDTNNGKKEVVSIQTEDGPLIQHYTVMIRSLPDRLREPGKLEEKMQDLFDDDIARVYVVPDVKELMEIEDTVKEHESALKALAKKHEFNYDDIFSGNSVPEIRGKLKCCGKCGTEMNLVEHYKNEYEKAVKELNELRDTKELELTNTAFVTFKSLSNTTLFVQSTKPLEFLTTDVTMAPEPRDIYWENLMFDPTMLLCRKFLISVLMTLLLIFWSIPVIAIQAVANLQSLFSLWGGDALDYFSQGTLDFVSGFLSVLVLDIFMGTLPVMMGLFSNILKPSHRGLHEIAILKRYYLCLVFMIMLVTVVASTFLSGGDDIWDYFTNFADQIGDIADLLAEGLASMSVYFLLYIMLNTFMTLPLEFFRISYHIAAYREVDEANRFVYSVWIPKILLIFTIVLTYSIMNPVMLIFGLFYFVAAYVVLKYHLSMSWVPALTMGPDTWVAIFNLVRYSYIIAQITLYGMLLLKSYVAGVVMLPLLYYCWNKTKEIMVRFEPIFKCASLTSAKHMDVKCPAREEMFEAKNPYQPPVMVAQYRLSE